MAWMALLFNLEMIQLDGLIVNSIVEGVPVCLTCFADERDEAKDPGMVCAR